MSKGYAIPEHSPGMGSVLTHLSNIQSLHVEIVDTFTSIDFKQLGDSGFEFRLAHVPTYSDQHPPGCEMVKVYLIPEAL
jgi:hypothetical protein